MCDIERNGDTGNDFEQEKKDEEWLRKFMSCISLCADCGSVSYTEHCRYSCHNTLISESSMYTNQGSFWYSVSPQSTFQ